MPADDRAQKGVDRVGSPPAQRLLASCAILTLIGCSSGAPSRAPEAQSHRAGAFGAKPVATNQPLPASPVDSRGTGSAQPHGDHARRQRAIHELQSRRDEQLQSLLGLTNALPPHLPPRELERRREELIERLIDKLRREADRSTIVPLDQLPLTPPGYPNHLRTPIFNLGR